MSILSKLQALLTAANATTGETDTTLTDAVQTLVDGYGQGGGGVLTGSITPSEDTNGMSINVGSSNFTHFVIYATAWPGDNDIKAFCASICDFSLQHNAANLATNNAGTSIVGNALSKNWFSKSENIVTCITGTTGTDYPGYWAAGITYVWFAW